jgi:hypothetical protein
MAPREFYEIPPDRQGLNVTSTDDNSRRFEILKMAHTAVMEKKLGMYRLPYIIKAYEEFVATGEFPKGFEDAMKIAKPTLRHMDP